ncbi:hypothetical protein ACFQ4Q_12710 [Lysobacter gummosus]|uniref:hypothetical protein n=1 Tax=Lysobacter gummosus TaxID=262324 RepID=UPI0036254936
MRTPAFLFVWCLAQRDYAFAVAAAAAAAVAVATPIAVAEISLCLGFALLCASALLLLLLLLLLLPLLGAACYSRDQGHPEGGAHGRAPGPTLGRMPNVGPARAGTALVAFDSKQLKPFLWLLSLWLWTKKVTRRSMAEAFSV